MSLVCSCFLKALAQKDYIITAANDTLKGEVKVNSFGDFKFKETGKNSFKKLSPDSVNQIYVHNDNLLYISKLTQSVKCDFLKCVESGKITLYEYFVPSKTVYGGGGFMNGGFVGSSVNRATGSSTKWFAGKENEPLMEVKTNGVFGSRARRESNISSLLGDDPELLNEFIDRDDFNFDLVKYLIRKYNVKHSVSRINQIIPSQDYAITISNDTLKGKIEKKSLAKDKFRIDGISKTIDISTDEIKEYYSFTDNLRYVSVFIPSIKPSFLKYLENGKINLFEDIIYMGQGYGYSTWYVNKGGNSLSIIFTNKSPNSKDVIKNNLYVLFADNEILLGQLKQEKKLTDEVIRAYIKQYNSQ